MKYTVGALMLLGLILGCEPKNEVAGDIGLQFYSLRKQFEKDVPGTLAKISGWGITTIEGGETYGVEMNEFLDLLSENNLSVVSVGADFNLLSESPEKIIENAKAFGAKYAMCPWIPHEGDTFTIEDTKNAVDVFNRAGALLAAEGIHLVYHAHGYEFRPYEEATLFDYMASNAKNFGFEMDVFWFQHGGADPMIYLNKYPDKFKLMHLKDMEHGTQGNDSGHEDVEKNVVLGTGMIDMAGLVKRARELGVEYMFIEDESSRVVEQVPQSLDFLSDIE